MPERPAATRILIWKPRDNGLVLLAKRLCIFCGASRPLTKEHVLPGWLQQYVGGSEKSGFRGTHVSWVGTPLSERKSSGNSHTLGAVCAPCNNGWMSRLESDFRTLLPRLQSDMSPRRFSNMERRTIAMWIVKTGIIAHRSANYRTILPDSVPLELSQGNIIPYSIKVFGGKVNLEQNIRWIQSNIAICIVSKDDVDAFDFSNNTFIFVLSINDMFIGFGWHGLDRNEFDIVSGNSAHCFYPHPKPATVPRVFEDLMIAGFEISLHRRHF